MLAAAVAAAVPFGLLQLLFSFSPQDFFERTSFPKVWTVGSYFYP